MTTGPGGPTQRSGPLEEGEASDTLLEVLAEAQRFGALGPSALEDHVRHASAFVDAVGASAFDGATVVDLGSGGGIPGLVVAGRCPTAHVTLLDGRARRAAQLERAVDQLGWSDRVSVLGDRAEVAGRSPELRGRADLVVSRGFGRPGVTAECAAPLLRVGGRLVVSEPPGAATTRSRWPAAQCAELGLELEDIVEVPWSFAVLRQALPCGERYARRVGIPEKRPLF